MIKAENISKVYTLGATGTGSLKKDLKRWWQRSVMQTDNSFFSIPDAVATENGNTGFWALRDISFEIEEGQVYGIVGRNGAGKSTLLKILSRITKPTHGTVSGMGSVSSLLEVGTGFHPELTGRENVYLSGHFLGMKKQEIDKNFEDIIEFSGIGQFIDTPVKRYSSGMYVRLAFAVAAHLNPDILIVDEVLAVGDAEFQKKCLGKMKDVVNTTGRTIVFVSHNMQAVNSLCTNAIWLDKGQIRSVGTAHDITNQYLSSYQRKQWKQTWAADNAPGNDKVTMASVELVPNIPDNAPLNITHSMTVKFSFINHMPGADLVTGLHLFNLSGECIFDVSTRPAVFPEGLVEGECTIPGNFLNDGSYYFSLIIVKDTSQPVFYLEECLHFDMEDFRENTNWYGKWQGYVRPVFPFSLLPK